MPITGPLGLVKLTREVSVKDINSQIGNVPRIALCGAPEERERLRELLLGGSLEETDRALLSQAVVEIDGPPQDEVAAQALGVWMAFTAGAPDPILRRLKIPAFALGSFEELQRAANRLADLHEDWILPLGRYVPALRPVMSERVIVATSSANAEIALISALPGVVPLAQLLFGPAAAADIVLLTKNQIMMILRLAAMHNKPMKITERIGEIAPVVGGAFGWRALARELVGLVPGGVGVAAKGSVAFAGTYTMGRAAEIYYARGTRVSRAEEKRLYTLALERARGVVAAILAQLRRRQPPAAPAAVEEKPGAADAPGSEEEAA